MKTKLLATSLGMVLLAGTSVFAQAQYDGDPNAGGPGYGGDPGAQGYGGAPGYNGAPAYNGAPGGYEGAQAYGGGQGYYPPAPQAYAAPPICGPGSVWVDGYYDANGFFVNGYCAVPPYSGAYWIGPTFYGGRFVAGYWGGSRGFVRGFGRDDHFRGGFRGDFRGGVRDDRFRNNFRGSQGFSGNNNFRSGQSFSGNNNFRGSAPRTNFRGGAPRSNFRGSAPSTGGNFRWRIGIRKLSRRSSFGSAETSMAELKADDPPVTAGTARNTAAAANGF